MNKVFMLLILAFILSWPYTCDASERIFFTATCSEILDDQLKTQVFSMEPDGAKIVQHTSSSGIKHGIYRCFANNKIYFSSNDSLACLNENLKEQILLSKEGTQYHSPKCSSDGKYLSVTAWDKEQKRGYIEIYNTKSYKRLWRWEGECASWMKGRNVIIYRLCTGEEYTERIDIYIRNIDEKPLKPKLILSEEVGTYTYDLTEPQIVGPSPKDFVFRVYDEHEYFYYFREIGKSFVLSRNGKELKHHNIYAAKMGPNLEQGQLSMSPDGNYAIMNEHPWNTSPSLYLVDIKTRDSWKIANGFNPVWSEDSKAIYFNKDPLHYAEHEESIKQGRIFPEKLNGYEIYVYSLEQKEEHRLTDDNIYQGFL